MPTEPKREPGRVSFVVAVLLNVAAIVVAASHEVWRPLLGGVVTDAFARVTWAMYLASAAQIVCNLALLQRPTPLLRRLTDFLTAALGLVGALVVYRVFPFDFERLTSWATPVARVVLMVGIGGAAIGTVVGLVRLLLVGGRGTQRPAHP